MLIDANIFDRYIWAHFDTVVMKKTFLLFPLSLLPFFLQAQFTLSGELRPRGEFRQGYKNFVPDTSEPVVLVSQRMRLNADFRSELFVIRLSLQDVRVWGDAKIKDASGRIGLYEAWGEWLINPMFSVKMGRQVLRYDNLPIFTVSKWGQSGVSHDALVFKVSGHKIKFHTGFAWNNEKELYTNNYYPVDLYKNMLFLWGNRKYNSGLNISLVSVTEGLQKNKSTEILYRTTTGGDFTFRNDSSLLEGGFQAFYQRGKTTAGDKLNSLMIGAKAGYRILPSFSILLAVDYFSGNDLTDTSLQGKTRAFYLPYNASMHGMNGQMDLLDNLPADTQNAGLVALSSTLTWKTSKSGTFQMVYWYFLLAGKYPDPRLLPQVSAADSYLASEIDISYTYKASKDLELQLGYCFMLPSETMKMMKGYFPGAGNTDVRFLQWAYVMVTFTPVFFTR